MKIEISNRAIEIINKRTDNTLVDTTNVILRLVERSRFSTRGNSRETSQLKPLAIAQARLH